MGLICTLYEFKKRENSTLRPDDTVTQKAHQCRLKDKTSLLYPDLIFDFGLKGNPSYYNYCYLTDLGNRYYFIRDWEVGPGQLWTAHCEVDVLASWKASIGASQQYVTRSSYTYNGNVVDMLYPTKQGVTITTVTADEVWKTPITEGYFVIGVTNDEPSGIGAVHYYALLQDQFNDLTSYLMSDVSWMEISDISEELQKALINPLQYISSCMWFPTTAIFGSAVDSIKVGFWDIPISAKLINTSANITAYSSIELPRHPQNARGAYLNGAPYSAYTLMFPGFGEIQLDANDIANISTLYFTVTLDVVTGIGKLFIHDGTSGAASGNFIRVVRNQVAVPIQLSQAATSLMSSIGGVIGGAASTVASLATGNVFGAISGVLGIGTSIDGNKPKFESTGNNGSFAEFQFPPKIVGYFYPVVDEDNANRGRPLCAVKTLSSVPGYQVIADPDIAIAGTTTENKMIKNYMASGYFYE